MSSVTDALITTSITSAVFLLYKGINHYRLRSSCNESNQLVVEVVDLEQPKVEEKKHEEKQEEIKEEMKT